GLKLCKRLREDFVTSHIPIILIIERRQVRKELLEIEVGVDDYLPKPPDPIDLEVRIEMALRRTEYQFYANALTKLPGNRAIEKIVSTKVQENKPFSFAYMDIDNFKSFNDKYSYMLGDMVIMQFANIAAKAIKKYGNKDDYLGHIGGDDFVFISTPDKEEAIAKEIIFEFDRLMPFHYDRKDRERGFIRIKDRLGNVKNTPIMSVSIAMANNTRRNIDSMVTLIEITFEIKRYLKTLDGSHYMIDRRTDDKGKTGRGKKYEKDSLTLPVGPGEKTEPVLRQPLGQRLINAKIIDDDQLNRALRRHWITGQTIGQTLVDMGFVEPRQIEELLDSSRA
ncbi:MAG: diguanylate cyclase, partial [Candidatus Omnitrophota bacterium]